MGWLVVFEFFAIIFCKKKAFPLQLRIHQGEGEKYEVGGKPQIKRGSQPRPLLVEEKQRNVIILRRA